MKKTVKIAVTGAAGQIGYALLFRLASGAVFGQDTGIELSLLELETALPALKGVVMELEDCAFPLLTRVSVHSDPETAFADVDWALLVGSVPRKAGMERKDLLEINGKVFVGQGQALDRAAKAAAKVLVVGNPCNTNALIAKSKAKRLAPENFFAMTMLDQNRAVAQLAQKAQVNNKQVKNMIVWGNHSATMFPDFFHAQINDGSIVDKIDEKWLKNDFLSVVQQRGSAIIKARGLSSAASAANAALQTVRKLEGLETPGEPFSVAVCSDGSYGVEKGLLCSFPILAAGSSSKGWQILKGLEQNDFAQEKIAQSVQELKQERDCVSALLGV